MPTGFPFRLGATTFFAFRGHISQSKLVTETFGPNGMVSPWSGVQGTIISVAGLFYNMPTRRKAITNTAEEYHRIANVVMRYAFDNPHVAKSCRKAGERLATKPPHARSDPTR